MLMSTILKICFPLFKTKEGQKMDRQASCQLQMHKIGFDLALRCSKNPYIRLSNHLDFFIGVLACDFFTFTFFPLVVFDCNLFFVVSRLFMT
jgi:hypothetical protein